MLIEDGKSYIKLQNVLLYKRKLGNKFCNFNSELLHICIFVCLLFAYLHIWFLLLLFKFLLKSSVIIEKKKETEYCSCQYDQKVSCEKNLISASDAFGKCFGFTADGLRLFDVRALRLVFSSCFRRTSSVLPC